MTGKRWATGFLIAVLLLAVSAATRAESPPIAAEDSNLPRAGHNAAELPNPLATRLAALRRQTVERRIRDAMAGDAAPLSSGSSAALTVAGQGRVWMVPGEFGSKVHPTYGGSPGPRHNRIPQPDPAVDNTTLWRADFSSAYYEDLLFSGAAGALSLRNYYEEQSLGVYSLDGDVAGWGRVPYNTARYGNAACGSNVCPTVWLFLRDTLAEWYDQERAGGHSPAQINAYLSQFDARDRYDYDGDGDYEEPDGYIDHFQSVFAGESDSSGFGDAITAHTWYAYYDQIGLTGPAFNMAGGLRVGNSNYWVGDYVMAPENVGVGLLAYGHARDLGLPPLFDAGSFPLGNMTGYWTLMSQGWQASDGQGGLGNKPTHLGAWEKLQLGWLDYRVAPAGRPSRHWLGPATTRYAQALIVPLPDKEVVIDRGAPHSGEWFYHSQQSDNRDDRMSRTFDLPAGASLSAFVRYQIEQDWDYAYLVASTDGGATWANVPTNLSTTDDPNGQNLGQGITGSSGGAWVELTADLSAYSGPTRLGFRYVTDSFFTEGPFDVDDISITGAATDGAETDAGWTFDPAGGFAAVLGHEVSTYFHAYIAEPRAYRGFDAALRSGPVCLCFLADPVLANWGLYFPYQDGLLISYWDGAQSDNNYGDHPGAGLILPIDAHPQLLKFEDNSYWADVIQTYDATFGRQRTEAISLHSDGQLFTYPSQRAVAVFDDNQPHWDSFAFLWQVRHPHTGTQIRVRSENMRTGVMVVDVR